MGAIFLVARARLRATRWSNVALMLMVGLAVAVVLAAVAGSRRTDGALRDFVAADRGSDAYAAFTPVGLGGDASVDLAPEAARIAAIPGVQTVRRFTNTLVAATDPRAAGGRRRLQAWIAMEPGGLSALGRLHLVKGRMPDDGVMSEIAVDEELARDATLRLGDHYPVRIYGTDQSKVSVDTDVAPEGVEVNATVVGIVRRPSDLRDLDTPARADSAYFTHADLYMTAALWDETRGDAAVQNPIVGLTVGPDVGLDAVLQTIAHESDGKAYVITSKDFLDVQGTFKGVQRSVSLQSRAFQVFAAVAALAGLFLVGQTIGRRLYLEAADNPTLLAMGMTRRELLAASLLRAAPLVFGGTAVGLLGAIALSPFAPLPGSVARRAELSPGIHADWEILALCVVVAPLLLLVASVAPLRATARADEPARRRPTLASRLRMAGGSAPAVMGMQFALEPGRGRTAVPVRTAMAAAAAALAVVLAAVGFIASLDGTRDHPSRYGVTWDLSAGAMTTLDEANARAVQVAAVPGIAAFSGAVMTDLIMNGHNIPFLFVRQDGGRVTPSLISGRMPQGNEVGFAPGTLADLDAHIGDTVGIDAGFGDGPQPFLVVGTFVMNTAGLDVSVSPDEGALLDWSAVKLVFGQDVEFFAPQSFLVRLAPDADRRATIAAVRDIFPSSTTPPIEPADLTNLRDVRLLPLALAGLVTLLGLGTVAHALLSSLRRRHRDLAVLRTLGFTPRDTRAAIAYQAVTFAAVAVVIGVPAGVIGGRLAWAVAANQLGIIYRPDVPVLGVIVSALTLIALLVALSAVPAWLAGRATVANWLHQDDQ